MKKFLTYAAIILAVFFVVKIFLALRDAKKKADAVKDAAVSTVKAPVNTASTIMAGGAFVWDLLSGKSPKQAAEIYTATTKNIWAN